LAQIYPRFELLLLDDNSRDGTEELATAAAQGDERFRLLHGEPLPAGWLGKNWACHQLAQAARGDLLLFLDADVQLAPGALAALVNLLSRENAGLLTIWPTQITQSWGERLVVPLMAFAILGYLPVLPVHYAPWPIFAAANGQCLLFSRAAYQQSGGHAAARGQVVEDVTLARRVKQAGLPLRMADGNRLVACRMYPGGWPQVRAGFAKNILAGHGNRVPFLLVSTVFHWLVFIFPWIWLIFGGGGFALGLGLAGVLLRALTAAFTRQRPFDALLLPVSVVLMTGIAFQSIAWHYRGGATWKGRTLKIED
jgi:chlorobactene glucosyltransferase